jgi:hypothetical protein
VVLGPSGGIASALSAAVSVDALVADRVRCVMLPSRYTSEDSLADADECARRLGVSYWHHMNLSGVGFDTDVVQTCVGERGREISWAAAHVEQGPAGRRRTRDVSPQVGDHRRSVLGHRPVEPGRVGLLVAELAEQPQRPGQRRPLGEQGRDSLPTSVRARRHHR